jgi:hypothetical protein
MSRALPRADYALGVGEISKLKIIANASNLGINKIVN